MRMMPVNITFIGTAAGLPTPERGLPAVLLDFDGDYLLLDCGEGTQRTMMQQGFGLCRRMRIFITHLHGDHVFGLPGMIQTMNLLNRVHPLELYGPPGLKEFLEGSTFSTMSEPVFPIKVHEVAQGRALSCKAYSVEVASAEHVVPDLAYRFEFGGSAGRFRLAKAEALGIKEGPLRSELKAGRSVILPDGRRVEPAEVLSAPIPGIAVVYTGDTRRCRSVVDLARGADLLIHEATFGADLAEYAAEQGHSTASDAAEVAKEACVKRLIMTHISARYPDPEVLVREARAVFAETDAAKDLARYVLKR